MKGRPDDWTPTVRKHANQVTGYIVAASGTPCAELAELEVARVNRHLVGIPLEGIATLEPITPWFMAVIVCPGNDLNELTRWARNQDVDRIHIYLHKRAEPEQLRPWLDQGLPLDRVSADPIGDFKELHRNVGLDFNDQVYGDFGPTT